MTKLNLHPKVAAGGQTGALATVILWAVETWGHVSVPGYVAAAVVTLLAGAGGWLKPSPPPPAPAPRKRSARGEHPT